MKHHFFISSRLSTVYRGFSALTSEASCSSYFMKQTRPKLNFKCVLSPQLHDQINPGPLQTEARRLTIVILYVESFQFQPGSIE